MSETAVTEEKFYTLWTVFKRTGAAGGEVGPERAAAAFDELTASLAADGVTLRGLYDVSAMRADADVMTWFHGDTPEALQEAVRRVRRSDLFTGAEIVWSAMGVHRNAEFSKDHSPAFARGVDPSNWVCVYPFVRSYDWYILDPAERGKMLRDHGLMGRDYPQVLSNTVASFALGDWEWILALEAPELTDLVDLMRHLRGTEARLHVREEIPFYTGRRIAAIDVPEVLA